MDSVMQGARSLKASARATVILLGITVVFWMLTNSWIAEDRHLFDFAHEFWLLATILVLLLSMAFSVVDRGRLSLLCLGLGAACLAVAAILWYWQMIRSY